MAGLVQSGVLPYRANGASSVDVLLVTSRSNGRWIIPKGNIEDGLSHSESAKKEAEEEAGATGTVESDPIGFYDYEKLGTRRRVEVYLMRVSELAEEWEEMDERKRQWFPATDAARAVREPELRRIIRKLAKYTASTV